jgi:hypothetical protein
MYLEKTTIKFYLERKLIFQKYTSLVPGDGNTMLIGGKHYTVNDIIWRENDVEIQLRESAFTAMLNDGYYKEE